MWTYLNFVELYFKIKEKSTILGKETKLIIITIEYLIQVFLFSMSAKYLFGAVQV
jgi:hypothetical protein